VAIKPTIYKLRIALSDLNRNYYDTLNLTVALHPSETVERMMVRTLAYCINAQEFLSFSRGLSAVEEPAVWVRSLDEQITLWIDVGEPSVERIKKARRMAAAVNVYCFNSKADHWWSQEQSKLAQLNVSVTQFPWSNIQTLAKLVQRTMEMSVTITGDSAFIAADLGQCEVSWTELQTE